jgi:selenium-binding protein 1
MYKFVILGHYGNKIHIWNWTTHELKQTIELEGPLGLMPLEVRFYHEPSKAHAFIGTALGSAVYHIYQENVIFLSQNRECSCY